MGNYEFGTLTLRDTPDGGYFEHPIYLNSVITGRLYTATIECMTDGLSVSKAIEKAYTKISNKMNKTLNSMKVESAFDGLNDHALILLRFGNILLTSANPTEAMIRSFERACAKSGYHCTKEFFYASTNFKITNDDWEKYATYKTCESD